MPLSFLLATRSADKLAEIRQILPASIHLIDLDQAGIDVSPDEDGVEAFTTFRENALAKARYFSARSGLPAIADDSGISVDALDGAPGVYSKRFAAGEGLSGLALDRANNALLLERLEGVAAEQRRARYVCAAAAVWPKGRAMVTLGTSSGSILSSPRGSGGFGYDPLFLPSAGDRSFGELTAEEKHALSHRGRAFRALAVLLALHPAN
jgi:XTP/dITP diphosphohydrolase